MVKAGIQRIAPVGVLPPPGERDEQSLAAPRALAHLASRLIPIEHRHTDVEQQQLRMKGVSERQCLGSIVDGADIMAVQPQ